MNKVVLLVLISTLSASPLSADHFTGHVDVKVG
ncbi:MAG: hypothetical protein ACJAYB_002849 [Psychromonas sp.]|jgi:hypothetical protein